MSGDRDAEASGLTSFGRGRKTGTLPVFRSFVGKRLRADSVIHKPRKTLPFSRRHPVILCDCLRPIGSESTEDAVADNAI